MRGMRGLWAALTVVGGVVPLALFVPWVTDHGLDVVRLWEDITGNPVAALAWADVAITIVAIVVLAARRIAVGALRFWWVVVGSLVLGASFGLPLYLYLRSGRPAD